ncbi:MAG TPA: DUF4340 domain-containing protein [Rhizomicrobium sp.]|jgi:hypothetical protein
MAPTNSEIWEIRRRNLLLLGAVAALAVVLAVLALYIQSNAVASHYTPEPFLPNLASEVPEIARVKIVDKKGTVDAVFKPARGWVIASHDDYPASFERLRETLVGLAALQTIEPKTARADWLHYVDLEPPPKGSGVAITLYNGKGETLAALITGKSEDIGDPSGAVGLFVRHPDSPQSYLVRSVFEPKTDAGEWLDKQVMDVELSRIAEADVNPLSGPSFEVKRDKPSVAGFTLVDLPQGRELSDSGAPDSVAAAITGFTFEDVRPVREFDFSDPHAARLVAKTFDGLVVTVRTIKQGQDYWSTVSADASSGKPAAEREAREIDRHASGWAYKVPGYKGPPLMPTLESLLKPLPSKTAPAAPAQPAK